MRRDLVFVGLVSLVLGCGGRTPLATGELEGVDASLDARDSGVVEDARADVRDARPDRAECCSGILLNATETPGGCVQGAAYIAFAIEATCTTPVQRIDVHTSAKEIALLADTGSGPGAILVPPTPTFVSDPGWFSIAPSGIVLQQGVRYFVAIGGTGTPCDFANQGDPVEYWGNFDGKLGKFEGPFFEPYMARVIAVCK